MGFSPTRPDSAKLSFATSEVHGYLPLNNGILTNCREVTKASKSLLSTQDRKLLLETRHLLEELLETEEVLRDKALMKSIRESQGDMKMGRVYTIEQLKRELPKEGRL